MPGPGHNGFCSVKGCDRKYLAKGYCHFHYYQVKKFGKVISVLPRSRGSVDGVCMEDGCSLSIISRGYCRRHYSQHRNKGEFTKEVCAVEDCDKSLYARNYCQNHYSNFLRSGYPLGVRAERDDFPCDCGKPVYARGMCKACYSRSWYREAEVTPQPEHRKEFVEYSGAHLRLRSDRGRAKSHECVDCGGPAEEWSLNPDAETLVSRRGARIGSRYSLNSWDYSPRCKPCHIALDVAVRAGAGYGLT
jgi:hypothetical protein